nr:UrcA family protein [Sphingomonas sp.]
MQEIRMRNHIMAACAFACLPAMAMAAQNPFAAPSATVRTDGLDLANPDGQRRLDARLADAAEAVCGRSVSHIHLAMAKKASQCRAEVIAEGRARLAADRSTELRGTD